MESKKLFFSKLYYFDEDISQSGLELTRSDEINTEEDFQWIHDVFKGIITPNQSVPIQIYKSGKKLDFHSFVETRIISKKITDALLKNNITGWATYPVTLLDKKKQPIEGYVGLSVKGRCGPQLKEEREKKQRLNYVGTDFMEVYVGFYFDPATWDGSDIFSPEGTSVIIVTEKVKLALEAADVTNVSFTPLTEFESLWQ